MQEYTSVLAKTVVRVLNELARSMGLSARKKVEQEFSVEKMITETEKVYLSLSTGQESAL